MHAIFVLMNAVSTREALIIVQVLFQKCENISCNIIKCMADYIKTFDSVSHEQMMKVMERYSINGKNLKIISNLYWNQSVLFRIDGDHADRVKIIREVRQRYIISLAVLNLTQEDISR